MVNWNATSYLKNLLKAYLLATFISFRSYSSNFQCSFSTSFCEQHSLLLMIDKWIKANYNDKVLSVEA